MKVAIAHDFIRHGGAERVLEQMHVLWPEAPIHTLLAEPHPEYSDWDIRSSVLQKWVPPRRYRWPLPFYPGMVDRLRFDPSIDLLLSSSVSWMKSAQAPPGVPHLCYIYRPMMFAYDRQEIFLAHYPRALRPVLRRMVSRIRRWDQARADRPDLYVACSRYGAEQVQRVYGREARVLYPPVRIQPFAEAGRRVEPEDFFLTALRLESYKRVDILVEACTRLGLPLKVVGRGPELPRLREMAGPEVSFLGFVPDSELPNLVASCRAFLYSAEEDFGIAPVEALAAGRPVIAYGYAGCSETVEDGVNGVHFPVQETEAVIAALRRFEDMSFDRERIRASAERFSESAFRVGLQALAEELVTTGSAREKIPQ